MKKLSLLLSFMLVLPLFANAHSLLNLKDGVAIKGYDPVAFFTDKKAVKGSEQFSVKQDGATYYFASREHLDMFKKAPAKYEPSYGGYCAYGVLNKKFIDIDPEAFQMVDNRLLLQYSSGTRSKFNSDVKANLIKSDENWVAMGGKKPRDAK